MASAESVNGAADFCRAALETVPNTVTVPRM
jgi:hypothetical protein